MKKTDVEMVSSKNEFEISVADKMTLLTLARKTLKEIVFDSKVSEPDSIVYSSTLETCCGAFVTLHMDGHLRGCIGHLTGHLPLYKMVQETTVSSALHDHRFAPVSPNELERIDIEISVLSPLSKVSDVSEILLGKHGVLIEKGPRKGVFLPQVATETNWNLESFLGHCARDKAGIGWEGWKTANIYSFTATVFGEKEFI